MCQHIGIIIREEVPPGGTLKMMASRKSHGGLSQ